MELTKEIPQVYQDAYDAAEDEQKRVNEAIQIGGIAIVSIGMGLYQVDKVVRPWKIHIHPQGVPKDESNSRILYGCNDSVWANIMVQLKVKRNPRWINKRR